MLEYLAENASLRQWSRRYVAGEVTLDEYRAARRTIIEALEQGKVMSVSPAQAQDFAATLSEATRDPRAFEESGNWSGEVAALMTPAAGVPVAPDAKPAAPAPTAPEASGSGLDPNSLVLAGVLILAALIALGVLVYVFVL
jgi:hypothetical protein